MLLLKRMQGQESCRAPCASRESGYLLRGSTESQGGRYLLRVLISGEGVQGLGKCPVSICR